MTDRWLYGIVGILTLAVLAVGGVRYGRNLARRAPAGEAVTLELFTNPVAVPDVSMKTLDGRTLSTADWRGKVVVVNFWATWCPPCRAEIPDLVALQKKYADTLLVIGVSGDEDAPAVVQQFADQYHINYPIVMLTKDIEHAFPGIYALPTSFIVNREGRVAQRHVGMLHADTTELEARVLAGLPTNATVKYVEYEDSNKKLIKDAAQATKIPGLDLDALSPAARAIALRRLNAENCTCGCTLTLAACRINDPGCNISLPIAQKVVLEAAASH